MNDRPPDRQVVLQTAKGPGRARVFAADRPVASLLLGHGAGGRGPSADLMSLAEHLPGLGVTVALIDQPWRVAGRKVAPAPATLDAAWVEMVAALRPGLPGRLVVGGRSAGARVACRTAQRVRADAVLALAFPLHPPGRPTTSRADELSVDRPLLVLQGANDPFGRPAEFPVGVRVVQVPGDHSLKSAVEAIVPLAAQFCRPGMS